MNKIYKRKLIGTTSAGGALTVTDTGGPVVGLVYAVQLIDGDAADGVDITLTCENSDFSMPILVEADFNSDKMVYPRSLVHKAEDGAALTGTAGGDRALPMVSGKFKMVIASGGATNAGVGCIIYYYDGLV